MKIYFKSGFLNLPSNNNWGECEAGGYENLSRYNELNKKCAHLHEYTFNSPYCHFVRYTSFRVPTTFSTLICKAYFLCVIETSVRGVYYIERERVKPRRAVYNILISFTPEYSEYNILGHPMFYQISIRLKNLDYSKNEKKIRLIYILFQRVWYMNL